MKNISLKTCPNCGSTKFKTWNDLTDDEKFLVEKLSDKSEQNDEQRKKQRFCSRCFFRLVEIGEDDLFV